MKRATILILYTTRYREGGAGFRRMALTLEREKAAAFPDCLVVCRAVETKQAFVGELTSAAHPIEELHFIGHSGMYGIMFGTTSWPEQMSPYEWRTLRVRFAPGARAYFHACRTARWFAPFFARTFGVRTYGYFWYTTLSRRPDRFSFTAFAAPGEPVHVISVPGRKSHGLLGAAKKHLLRHPSFPMQAFDPVVTPVDTTYDPVADLYDETFEDIAVRRDERAWLRSALSSLPRGRLLDIGCGTGSFLRAIRDLVETADGVDLSARVIAHAQRRSLGDPKLAFTKVDGPMLPFPDASFDVVMSVLSFRYLDWDPLIREVLRVLEPGGTLLVVDMVAAPLALRHWPHFAWDKLRQQAVEWAHPRYRAALRRMVADPRWKKMVEYNPIRAEHELRWYLQSRFPGGRLEVINRGLSTEILAFRSAPVAHRSVEQLSYP